ncbi:MAG: helix-turn-helix transcriptional regulator [Pseudodesulfovibrio sp.]|nr:helix-turn-helix transcriptional regulator [Pseudodesulfovibrio sp.]
MGKIMAHSVDTKKIASIMKALSNPNRLDLFLEIAAASGEASYQTGCGCECFVSEIVKRMKIGAPTVSHHLKELSTVGLIETERRGKFVVAWINEPVVKEIRDLLKQVGCVV